MIKPSDRERTITIIRDNNRIRFNFGFHPGLQEKLKELLSATFDDKEKLWSVDAKHEDRLKRAFKKFIPKGKCVDADGKPVDFRPRPPKQPPQTIKQKLAKTGNIMKLGNSDYVMVKGLLLLAHENGIESITSEIIHFDTADRFAIVQVTAVGTRGTFTGIGDASPDSLKNRAMVPAFIRMAETRAVGRALRLYLGIGDCTAEELPTAEKDGLS